MARAWLDCQIQDTWAWYGCQTQHLDLATKPDSRLGLATWHGSIPRHLVLATLHDIYNKTI
jgi:hypothetical protein